MIDLKNKNILIAGGGRIALRRIQSLLDSGGSMTVISPTIDKEIRALWQTTQLTWKQKHLEAADLTDVFFIIAATNDTTVNQLITDHAPPNALINMASQAEEGDVHFPAQFRQGKLSISISTEGASPLLAAKIKEKLQAIYDDKYGEYVDFLYESRQLIKQSLLDKNSQALLLKELMAESFIFKQKQYKTIAWLHRLSGKEQL